MSLRTLGGAVLTLVLALPLIPVSAGTASAKVEACSENVPAVRTAPLKLKGTSVVYGTIELRRDTCHRYWAYLKLTSPVSGSNRRATAVLARWEDGLQVPGLTCGSPGGNGYIVSGQTSCRTPKVSWDTVDGFMATGHYDLLADGDVAWRAFAVGQTTKAPGGASQG